MTIKSRSQARRERETYPGMSFYCNALYCKRRSSDAMMRQGCEFGGKEKDACSSVSVERLSKSFEANNGIKDV